jgi:uncharacterized protein YecT (DUF1311 family)
MKYKKIALIMVVAVSIIALVACSKDNKKVQDTINQTEQNQQAKDSTKKVDNISKSDSSTSTKDITVNKNIEETNISSIVTKIEGRREELQGRLDYIQKQLDALPEKKDSDAGTTIAMRSYYGKCYDMYDKALNEIYSLLKEKLSQDTMKSLQNEEAKWVQQKEETAKNAAGEFKGGTFEPVAYNVSLYESTRHRCYELVNNYMTDSKIKININKQTYIDKIENLQKELLSSQEYKNSLSGETSSMIIYTDKEYKAWDTTLNEIYSLLKKQLPSDEMKNLDKEEMQWITQKENNAKKSQEAQGVGSQLGNISYQASLAHTSQSRCYELVYRYMK